MKNNEFQITLGEIASFRRGVSYKGSELAESESDGTPMINMKSFTKEGKYRPEGIKFHNGIFKEKDFIKPNEIVLANTDLTKEGDILGAAIMLPVELQGQRVVGSHHTTILTVIDERINPNYIARVINTAKIRIEIKRYRRGATVKGITSSDLKRIVIQIPSLNEQKRIVDILAKAGEIKQAVETTLIKRQECIRSTLNEMCHLNDIENSDWPVVELNEIATKINDGEHGTVKRADSGRLYLMARNITKDNSISLDNISYIPQSEHERIYKRCNPEPGDLMLVCVGATIGKVALVPKMEEFSLARSVALIKPEPTLVNSSYLLYIFSSDYIKNQINSLSRTAAQAGLYIGKIKSIKVPLPPLELQEKFAKIAMQIENMANPVSLSITCQSSLVEDLIAW